MTFTPMAPIVGAKLFLCDECGACVVNADDEDESRLEQHRRWHVDLDRRIAGVAHAIGALGGQGAS